MKAHKQLLRGAYQFAHLGLTFAISVLAGFFAGYWLDGKLHTSPLFVLIGAFTGAAGGFTYLIRAVIQGQKDNDADEKEKSDRPD